MNIREINAFLAIKGIKVKDLAAAIGEPPASVGQVLNYLRPGHRIRQKIADHFQMPVNEFFDPSIDCRPARFREPARSV